MVKMPEQKSMSSENSLASKGFNVNPLDLVKYLLANWYWFALSLALFCGYGWYKYSTTQFRYSTSATVMFKDARASAQMAGLDRLANTTPRVNISNEILQFQSPELMRQAVLRLHAEVDYTVMDYLRVKELYSQTPVRLSFIDAPEEKVFDLKVTPIDGRTVRLSSFSTGGDDITVNMGDTVKTPVGKVLATKTLYYGPEWYGRTVNVSKNSVRQVVSKFCGNLSISQGSTDDNNYYGWNDSSILYLSYEDVSPSRAEDVLNMLIAIYNEETITDKNQIAINTSNFIEERLAIIEKELGGVESQIQSYKEANNMVDINSFSSTEMGHKEQYGTQVKDLMLQQQTGSYISNYLNDPSKATELIPANTGLADGSIDAQINQYNAAKLRRDKLLEGGGENNPVVEDLNNELNSMRQNIRRSVDNMNANIRAKINDISNRANQASARVSQLPRQQRQMLSIERQQHIKEELYLYLLNKREENALSLATTESNARVLQPAQGFDSPVSPILKALMARDITLAVGLPLAILVFLFFFDTKVKNRKDIEEMTSVPFIGEIPKHTVSKDDKDKGNIVVLSNGRDITSEAFRIVRTNMDFMRVKAKELKVITFSSFGAGAGKTFVSSNLAASFAQTGKKVILIDLDIRKGTLSYRTKHKQTAGMTNYLSGQAKLEDIIVRNSICENLDVIPSGSIAPNPAELLLSQQLDDLIAYLRTKYDYIFVDNVPYGVVADAVITNRIADLTVFVVRVGRIDRRMLPDIEKLYVEGKLNNLSLILNGAPLRSAYGYSYGYGYGYGYGSYGGYTHQDTWWSRLPFVKKRKKHRHERKHEKSNTKEA